MDDYCFGFTATIVKHNFGRVAYTVVFAPTEVLDQISIVGNPRLRIDGTVCGNPFHGAFQPAGNGRYYLILSKQFRRLSRLAVGDSVIVRFDIADQDAVDVPRELEFAIMANRQVMRIWDSFSAGKKRGLAYRVSSAKRVATREQRVEEVIEAIIRMGTN